jgi:hypothetical protein
MWLKDFLPRDVKGIRIMSYGYNANLVGHTVDDGFLDYRRNFIHMLVNSRSSAEVCGALYCSCAHVCCELTPSQGEVPANHIHRSQYGWYLDTAGNK